MILSIVGATMIVFGLSRAAGDPILLYAKPGGYGMTPESEAAIRAQLGLDRPLVIQYALWLGRTLKGDLGQTLLSETPVATVIQPKIGASLQLGFAGWLFATIVGIPLGIVSAVKRGSYWDYVARTVALIGQSAPAFWLGIVAVQIFAVQLGWLPSGTRGDGEGFILAWSNLRYFVLPTITLGWFAAAGYLRVTRSSMLDILDSEFIKLAKAKGVSYRTVVWKHAFRNALLQPLTVSSLVMAGLITGAVTVEVVFAWPGMGRLSIEAVNNNDFPLLTAAVLFWVVIFVMINFFTDLLYAVVDPRIRYS